jgi:cytochrome c-type biogenesis protein CcmH
MSMARLRAVIAALCLVIPGMASAALTVEQVARELRCPTCNLPLNISDAPVAQRMKAFISRKIDAGWDKHRIIDEMAKDTEFGREVLLNPPKSGFDLVAWVVPPLIGLGGLLVVGVVARTSRRTRAVTPDDDPLITDEERKRLDDLLSGSM